MADSGSEALKAALACLDVFASAGADRFDVSRTDIDENPHGYRQKVPIHHLRRDMAIQLDSAARWQRNLIIRPHSPRADFIQLDDLDAAALDQVKPFALLILQTSPKGSQAWIALDAPLDRDYTRRVRKATGADLMASGATRIPGSRNFKHKYAPDFPQVAIAHANPGRIVSRDELERHGLVAPPEEYACAPLRVSSRRSQTGARTWPSYDYWVKRAPKKADGSPDRSIADFNWCRTAIDWGWSVQDTAAHLPEVSEKARGLERSNSGYKHVTAQHAAEAVERGQRGRA